MLTMAWRNLWRVPRRTVLTLAAITLGVTGIVFLQSYTESTFTVMMRAITGQLVGHLQVHGKGYQESPDVMTVVRQPQLVEARLAQALPGVHSEQRVLGAALAGANDASSGVLVMGLQSGEGSSMITIKQGRGLSAKAAKEVVVGTELATQLDAKVGGELVLLGQSVDGSVANDRFTIVGIGDTGTSEMNSTGVFLHLADAQDFFGLGDAVHVMLLRLPTEQEDVTPSLTAARAALDLTSLEALSWNEMLPELRNTMESKRKNQRAAGGIVFLLVALGVLNVMTMSTFERTREFGVMLAIGTRPSGIIKLVVWEAVLQGLLGLALGVAASVAMMASLGSIDMGAAAGDFMGVHLPSVIELKLQWASVLSAGLIAVLTMVAAGLLPAWRASRLEPAVAVREA
jgi:ABC-type lipoprotein release transport system permease subunit